MLFNSYTFIFLFLPLTLVGFYWLDKRRGRQTALAFLVFASWFFYAWWKPEYLGLLLGSITVNFLVGRGLAAISEHPRLTRKALLTLGILFNLGLLGYFKYADFFLGNLGALAATEFTLTAIILPLAISFFTFQQIMFLVDSYRGDTDEPSFLHYALFVSFFPQLIAGPIVHHKELLPQFRSADTASDLNRNLAVGLVIFAIGLFKKVIIADELAAFANPVFEHAADGEIIGLLEAWKGALAYTFQLYFDFSGYSDMAIGGARLFGIKLPVNFNSPYKATSIIEFWRRWHMTLSRFLRNYLYIPLGGNRNGPVRRNLNLMVTMLLGGLWHGASWTFVLWGGLHGLYLIINRVWRGGAERSQSVFGRQAGRIMTFTAVVAAWVIFRSPTLESGLAILEGMAGWNGLGDGLSVAWRHLLWSWSFLAACLVLCFAAPSTQELLARFEPALDFDDRATAAMSWRRLDLRWRPTWAWAIATGLLLGIGILGLPNVAEFIYYRF